MPYPIDSSRLVIIATSGARPAPAMAELSDGSMRAVPGEQAKHKTSGLPIYQVDAVIPGDATDEKSRATPVTVKVATATKPEVQVGMPVRFTNLGLVAYVGRDGRAALSWSADGIEPAIPARADRAA